MSNVLSFRAPVARRPGRSLQPDEPRGEILFFTGVRIERHVETEIEDNRPATDGASRGRRRKA